MEILTQMDLTLLAVIIVLLVLAAVVIGAGTLTYALQAWRSKHEPKTITSRRGRGEESPRLTTETASAAPAQEGTVLQPEDELPTRPGEVMRVLRDESSGALVVEVEGQRYRRLTEIRDGRVGRRVLWAIADLLRFAEEVPLETVARTMPATAAPPPAPQPEVAPAAPPTPASELSAKAPPEIEEEFLRRLKEGRLTEEGKEPSRPAGSGFLRRKATKPSLKPAEPRTFVDEIEDILQEFIRTSVVPVDKPAHVHTGPDGALEIEVDGRVYERPDDVPDPVVRGLIKAAVEEWERR
ncbi:MAG: hypothetical protein ACUVWZ_16560 [Anaerolineae bacterium]